MILLSLGLLANNLKCVKITCTYINVKNAFKVFTNRWRNDNIFTYFLRKINKVQRFGNVVLNSTLYYLPVYIIYITSRASFTGFALH